MDEGEHELLELEGLEEVKSDFGSELSDVDEHLLDELSDFGFNERLVDDEETDMPPLVDDIMGEGEYELLEPEGLGNESEAESEAESEVKDEAPTGRATPVASSPEVAETQDLKSESPMPTLRRGGRSRKEPVRLGKR